MNYTYQIARIAPKQGFMRVVYQVEGYPDIHQNFSNMVDFTAGGIQALIEERAALVDTLVARMDAAPELPALEEGYTAEATYTKPVPPVPVPPTQEELVAARIDELALTREVAERQGVLWTDAQGDTYAFDTTVESQNRFTAATAAQGRGNRQDGSVWKCAKLIGPGEFELAFRPMTNLELNAVTDLVYAHIQKCFETEAVCVAQVRLGNLAVDFATEYAAL